MVPEKTLLGNATSGGTANTQSGITFDDIFIVLYSNGAQARFSNNGALLSTTVSSGGVQKIGGTVDSSGNIFPLDAAINTLVKSTETGTALSGSGFTGGGLNNPVGLARDGAGTSWIANSGNGSVSQFTTSRVLLPPATGLVTTSGAGVKDVLLDLSGNVWLLDSMTSNVTRIILRGPSGPARKQQHRYANMKTIKTARFFLIAHYAGYICLLTGSGLSPELTSPTRFTA